MDGVSLSLPNNDILIIDPLGEKSIKYIEMCLGLLDKQASASTDFMTHRQLNLYLKAEDLGIHFQNLKPQLISNYPDLGKQIDAGLQIETFRQAIIRTGLSDEIHHETGNLA